jgi:arylsulfatase A-like enzyme
MPAPRVAVAENSAPAIRIAAALFAGSALLAAVDAATIAFYVPFPVAGLGLRLAHHLFDAAETLGVGALAGCLAGAWMHFVRVPPWATVIVAVAATTALVQAAIGENLLRMASLAGEGHFETGIFLVFLCVSGGALVGAYALGARGSGSPRLRALFLALAVAILIVDHIPFPDDYVGIHGVVAWGAALLGGGAVGAAAERTLGVLVALRRGRVALAAIALFAVLGLGVPPSNAVRFELFRERCAVAPWVLATAVWRAPPLHRPIEPPSPSRWLRDRSADPDIPASAPRLLPPGAVIVVITVDAVGAQVVDDPANEALLPTMAELKREGVVFTHASAPGTQTALSLATLFSSRYFSELVWTDHGVGGTRYLYPADDASPRFPALLSEHGVATADYAGLVFLAADFGVARGFREETVTVEGRRHAQATELIDPLLERLKHAGRAPLFLYTHLLEPHQPYDRGRSHGTAHERYLAEVAVADAQIRRVLRMLQMHFGKRWALFVSADHGEAFGEHGGTEHGKTLYEELLHVPLLACGPLFVPRTVEERVGLVDLGPTILDLFGVPTPATYEGQSLVPLLAGEATTLTRPLLAEGRLRRALIRPDGLKVIEDSRRKVVEVYDLATDPGETRNLFDQDPSRVDPALAELRAFFAVHTRTEGGYRPRYKP